MLNKLILSIFLCLGLTSVSAEEVGTQKMRQAVKRVLQFVDADYSIYAISNKPAKYDEKSDFGYLTALLNTYQLNKNVWYLGKMPMDTELNMSVEECYNPNKKNYYAECIDAFAVQFAYYDCSGSACGVDELWLSAPKANTPDFDIKIGFDNSFRKDFKGKYFELTQTKKPPYPEFVVMSYVNGKDDNPNFPTLKYQQKFRFNNKTGKFEEIGKAKFLGKIQYCNNKIIPISQKCKD